MGVRKHLNQILKKSIGYYAAKTVYGADLWYDVVSLCGRSSHTVFDVGANEGESTLNFLKLFPSAQVYSFEPLPEAFITLEALARSRGRIIPLNMALGAENISASLNRNTLQTTSSLLSTACTSKAYLRGPALSTQRKVDISVKTLDAIAGEFTIGAIDLLKIDVQGYELNVLKGASQMLGAGRIRVIVLEVNFAPLYEQQASFQEICSFLQSHSYSLSCLYDFAFSTRKELMWCEALFCRND